MSLFKAWVRFKRSWSLGRRERNNVWMFLSNSIAWLRRFEAPFILCFKETVHLLDFVLLILWRERVFGSRLIWHFWVLQRIFLEKMCLFNGSSEVQLVLSSWLNDSSQPLVVFRKTPWVWKFFNVNFYFNSGESTLNKNLSLKKFENFKSYDWEKSFIRI